MSESDLSNVSVGSPSLESVKKYFQSQRWKTTNANRLPLSSESSTSSEDLNDSFKNFLENRKEQLEMDKENVPVRTMQSDDLPSQTRQNNVGYPIWTMSHSKMDFNFKSPSKLPPPREWQNLNNTTIVDDPRSHWMKVSEESFMAAERLCKDTTINDSIYSVDSFYEDRKTQTSMSQDSLGASTVDNEEAAIDRLLAEACILKQNLSDQTMLNEVEAPSCLWDQTSVAMSPMKMVGFLRPSTIMEENSSVRSDTVHSLGECSSETESMVTAGNKSRRSLVSSDSYATAQDDTLSNAPSIDKTDVIEISDDSSSSELESPERKSADGESADEESVNNSANVSHEFNDTIEMIEHMMQQGMNCAQENEKITPQKAESQPRTPETVVKRKPNTPFVSPLPFSGGTFKKPLAQCRLPVPGSRNTGAIRKQPAFSHIVSPISVYINNQASSPLVQNTYMRDNYLHVPTMNNRKGNVVESHKTADENPRPPVLSLPKKGYRTNQNILLYDERTTDKLYGGEKMQKLIGTNASPTVCRHEKREKIGELASQFGFIPRQSVDQSFADLSVASGDVSVQVLKNTPRRLN